MNQLKFQLPQKGRYSVSGIAAMSVTMLQHFNGICSILTCYTYGKNLYLFFFFVSQIFYYEHFCLLFCQRFVFAWTAVADVYNIEMLLVKFDADWEKTYINCSNFVRKSLKCKQLHLKNGWHIFALQKRFCKSLMAKSTFRSFIIYIFTFSSIIKVPSITFFAYLIILKIEQDSLTIYDTKWF